MLGIFERHNKAITWQWKNMVYLPFQLLSFRAEFQHLADAQRALKLYQETPGIPDLVIKPQKDAI